MVPPKKPAQPEAPPPDLARPWFVHAAVVGVLALAFHRFWTGIPIFKDSFQNFAPYKKWIAESLAHGTVWAWYPWSFLGMPFTGNIEAGWFYPLNGVYLLFPFGSAHRIFLLVHFPLAAMAMAAFLRGRGTSRLASLLGGLAFAFSGYLICQHATVTMLIGAAWAPLALHFMDRALTGKLAWAAASGAVLALQVLGGDPQSALVTAILAAVIAVAAIGDPSRRPRAVAAVGIAAAASLLLGAVQLVPTAEMMRMTSRGSGIPLDEATVFSFHPGRIVELVWPSPFGVVWPKETFWGRFALEGTYDNPWAITEYLGLPLLALAAVGAARGRARWKWAAVAGAGIFLLLAFGRHTPVYGALHAALPPFDRFRYPEKYMAGFAGCMAALAALGLDAILARGASNPAALRRGAIVLAATAAAVVLLGAIAWPGVAASLTGQSAGGPRYDAAIQGLRLGGLQLVTVNLAVAVVAWLAAARRIPLDRAAGAFVAILVLDWTVANVHTMPVGPGDIFDRRPVAAAVLEPAGRPELGAYRIFREPMPFRDPQPSSAPTVLERQRIWERSTLLRNLDAMEGFEDLVGYSGSKLVDGLALLKQSLTPPMLEVFGVRYVISPYGRGPIAAIRSEVAHADAANDLTILRLPDSRPRAYWTPAVKFATDDAEAQAILRAEASSGVAVITGPPRAGETSGALPEIRPVTIRRYEPDRVVLDAELDRDGWVVLSDRFYPGWAATVDGQTAEIRKANVMVRAVRVAAGRHTVEFAYRPATLRIGALVSLAGWACAIAWWIAAARRS